MGACGVTGVDGARQAELLVLADSMAKDEANADAKEQARRRPRCCCHAEVDGRKRPATAAQWSSP